MKYTMVHPFSKTLFLLIWIFIPSNSIESKNILTLSPNPKIYGTFINDQEIQSFEITLKRNKKFTMIYNHFEIGRKKSAGNYIIQNDTIKLFYKDNKETPQNFLLQKDGSLKNLRNGLIYKKK